GLFANLLVAKENITRNADRCRQIVKHGERVVDGRRAPAVDDIATWAGWITRIDAILRREGAAITSIEIPDGIHLIRPTSALNRARIKIAAERLVGFLYEVVAGRSEGDWSHSIRAGIRIGFAELASSAERT